MIRGLDRNFLAAMREKLEHGRRKGFVGWDSHWKEGGVWESLDGPTGLFVKRLLEEVAELIVALASKRRTPDNKKAIRLEAADVANFAMMIADVEGALEPIEAKAKAE